MSLKYEPASEPLHIYPYGWVAQYNLIRTQLRKVIDAPPLSSEHGTYKTVEALARR